MIGEAVLTNNTVAILFELPVKIASGVSLKFTAVPTANGAVTTVARGYLKNN